MRVHGELGGRQCSRGGETSLGIPGDDTSRWIRTRPPTWKFCGRAYRSKKSFCRAYVRSNDSLAVLKVVLDTSWPGGRRVKRRIRAGNVAAFIPENSA